MLACFRFKLWCGWYLLVQLRRDCILIFLFHWICHHKTLDLDWYSILTVSILTDSMNIFITMSTELIIVSTVVFLIKIVQIVLRHEFLTNATIIVIILFIILLISDNGWTIQWICVAIRWYFLLIFIFDSYNIYRVINWYVFFLPIELLIIDSWWIFFPNHGMAVILSFYNVLLILLFCKGLL